MHSLGILIAFIVAMEAYQKHGMSFLGNGEDTTPTEIIESTE
jgi:hypothetical protein|tara:strand:+ start:671 stop:796 length:126 start_codon:yes stop_codon:yes gene_type:complete